MNLPHATLGPGRQEERALRAQAAIAAATLLSTAEIKTERNDFRILERVAEQIYRYIINGKSY